MSVRKKKPVKKFVVKKRNLKIFYIFLLGPCSVGYVLSESCKFVREKKLKFLKKNWKIMIYKKSRRHCTGVDTKHDT